MREFAHIAASSMRLAGRPLGNFARIDRADYQDRRAPGMPEHRRIDQAGSRGLGRQEFRDFAGFAPSGIPRM